MTDIKKINEDLEYARYHCTSSKGKDAINDALNLINRQQAEIKRLTTLAKLGNMRADDYRAMRDKCKTARAEAIKEFAERLKEKHSQADILCPRRIVSLTEMELDNLVKEMVGEE
jgi:hypothetical protein